MLQRFIFSCGFPQLWWSDTTGNLPNKHLRRSIKRKTTFCTALPHPLYGPSGLRTRRRSRNTMFNFGHLPPTPHFYACRLSVARFGIFYSDTWSRLVNQFWSIIFALLSGRGRL